MIKNFAVKINANISLYKYFYLSQIDRNYTAVDQSSEII